MTTAEMEARIADLLRQKDYHQAACFIVDHGRSSLDLKVLVSQALVQIAATGRDSGVKPLDPQALVESIQRIQNDRARSLGRTWQHGMTDEYLRGVIVGLEMAGALVNGSTTSEALVFVTAFQDSIIKQVKERSENA